MTYDPDLPVKSSLSHIFRISRNPAGRPGEGFTQKKGRLPEAGPSDNFHILALYLKYSAMKKVPPGVFIFIAIPFARASA